MITTSRALLSIGALLAVAQLTACETTPGKVERRWSEEIALDGGEVITVDRLVEFQESNSLAGDAYSSTEINSMITFRGDLAKLPPWNVALTALVLYRDQPAEEWVIVATTNTCEVWYARGSPMAPYWEFRQKGDSWQEVPLSLTSHGRKTNLFFGYEKPLPAKMISRALKESIIVDNRIDRSYLEIDPSSKTNCTPGTP